MRFAIPLLFLLAAGFAVDRAEQHGDTGFIHDKADQIFVQSIAESLEAEQRWAILAARRASTPPVRAFAAAVMTERVPLATELRGFASARGIAILPALDASADVERLTSERGIAFERIYVEATASLRQITVDLLEHEAAIGLDLELKAWARSRLPDARERLTQVRALAQPSAPQ